MKLRDGTTTTDARLDRLPSRTTEHLERYVLDHTHLAAARPMLAGFDWYSNFDEPIEDRRGVVATCWIGKGSLGRRRGSHAACLPPEGFRDPTPWWDYHDQGDGGRAVEYAASRMLAHLWRRKFDLSRHDLDHQGRRYDEYPADADAAGTTVRAVLEAIRVDGAIAKPRRGNVPEYPSPKWSVAEYRWAISWDLVRAALGVPDDTDGVPVLNSWGRRYPHVVRLTDEAGERLLAAGGEFGVVTHLDGFHTMP